LLSNSTCTATQWFHFRVTGAGGSKLQVVIDNAGEASYPDGWHDYKAFCSADRKAWHRVQTTSYVDGKLVIDLDPVPSDCVHLAYFVPYHYEQHLDLIAAASSSSNPEVTHHSLGTTLDGRPLDCLRFGTPGSWAPEAQFAGASPEDAAAVDKTQLALSPWEREGGAKRVVWIIARQHPGESMASWWMEGFVRRLLDAEDPVARRVLRRAVVYVVPNMNPDGSIRGHLRTNAGGANLNREWGEPSLEASPEVFHTRNAMDATGPVDLMLDVHGDEAEPYCFIIGGEGTPGWDERRAGLQRDFKEAYARWEAVLVDSP
jgi:murein tripeptide amidase MpaA